MKDLITIRNLTFTKKNCNCGITSDALDTETKSRKKSKSKLKHNHKSKLKHNHKSKTNKKRK